MNHKDNYINYFIIDINNNFDIDEINDKFDIYIEENKKPWKYGGKLKFSLLLIILNKYYNIKNRLYRV